MIATFRHSVLFVLAIAVICCPARQGRAQDPSVPELDVLNHYLGEWDTKFTINANALGEKATEMKGRVSANWVLGGRFLEQRARIRDDDGKEVYAITTLMTFDPASKGYRTWTFTSAGTASESRGTWDAGANALTFVGSNSAEKVSTTVTATFVKDGEEDWIYVTKDPAGNTVSTISGKNIRRDNK